MQMIRQDHDRVDRERVPRTGFAKCGTECVDVFNQQTQSAIGEIDREEIACAGKEIAPVIRHRDAWPRWVSLRSTHPTRLSRLRLKTSAPAPTVPHRSAPRARRRRK